MKELRRWKGGHPTKRNLPERHVTQDPQCSCIHGNYETLMFRRSCNCILEMFRIPEHLTKP